MINNKKQMFVVIGAFLLVMLLTTVTYAFFNYTRTGVANRIQVGRIYFNTEQTTINLDNAFLIASDEVANDTDNVSVATIHVTGDTTYTDGIEYLVTATNINNTINDKVLPINVNISYEANNNKTIGTNDEEYYDHRGGNSSIYRILSNQVFKEDNNKLLVGYIAPGETGIDGTITIKSYLDKDRIAISDTYPEYTKRIVNSNMTQEEIETCASYLVRNYVFYNDLEAATNFCNGTGLKNEKTFQEMLDDGSLYSGHIPFLEENNIILVVYSDNTTNEWAKDRIILTTTEWNSLQNTPISFKVKVEANEGIWAELPGNAMGLFPSDVFIRYGINNYVKEIYFDRMSKSEMHDRYDDATIKANITTDGEGEVLTWLETNSEDSSKYTMYVVSDGITILNQADDYLFYNMGLCYADKIEFNNVNTSRITNMKKLFNRQENLEEIDISSFDTSNVVNIYGLVYSSPNIKKVNMEGLDLRKAKDMSMMFYSNQKLEEVNLDGVRTRDVETMLDMFYNSNNIEYINLEGMGGDNLETITDLVGGSSVIVKNINMKNFNFGKVDSLYSAFSSLIKLESIDLSGAKMNNVTSMRNLVYNCTSLVNVDLSNIIAPNLENTAEMFRDCTSLNKIYVSSSWNLDNVTTSNNMFYNCSAIEGGNGTTYDSTKLDKEYAIIDGTNNLPGYLTLKTN